MLYEYVTPFALITDLEGDWMTCLINATYYDFGSN
jgi:hypothetical protein